MNPRAFFGFALLAVALVAIAPIAGTSLLLADVEADRAQDGDHLRQLANAWLVAGAEARPAASGPYAWIALFTGESVSDETGATRTIAPILDAEGDDVALLFSPADPAGDELLARVVIGEYTSDPYACVFPGYEPAQTQPAGDGAGNGGGDTPGDADEQGDADDTDPADEGNAEDDAGDAAGAPDAADAGDTGGEAGASGEGTEPNNGFPYAAGWPITSYAGPIADLRAATQADIAQTIIGCTGSRGGVSFFEGGFNAVRGNGTVEYLEYATLARSGIEAWRGVQPNNQEPPFRAEALANVENLDGPVATVEEVPDVVEAPRWPTELTPEQADEAAELWTRLQELPSELRLTARTQEEFQQQYDEFRATVVPLLTTYAAWEEQANIEALYQDMFTLAQPRESWALIFMRRETDAVWEIIERRLRDTAIEDVPADQLLFIQQAFELASVNDRREIAWDALTAAEEVDLDEAAAPYIAFLEENDPRFTPEAAEQVRAQLRENWATAVQQMDERFREKWPLVFEFRDPAPAFSLMPIDEDAAEPVTLESLRGKTVFLYFYNAWAEPCQRLIPGIVDELHTLHGTREEVAFIAIGTNWSGDADTAETAADQRAFVEEHDLAWTHLYDASGRVTRAYLVDAVPTFFLIDIDGTILANGKADVLDRIRAILNYRFDVTPDDEMPPPGDMPDMPGFPGGPR